MTLTGIASRYALALVDAITSPKADIEPHAALSQLEDFVGEIAKVRDLELVLLSPSVSPARKRAVISRIADAMGMHRLVKNFLMVLSDHRRMASLREVLNQAAVALDEKLGFLRASVDSAFPLSDEDSRRISQKLESLTGKRIRMDVRVVPDLIGGVVAHVGSTVYDGSVRGQLNALGERLAAG